MRLFLLLLLSSAVGHATTCLAGATAPEIFARSKVVFLGETERFAAGRGEEGEPEFQFRVRVIEPFKGIKRGERVSVLIPYFSADLVAGKRQLWFLQYRRRSLWIDAACSQTLRPSHVGSDLLFLRGLPRSATGNRLAGVLQQHVYSPQARRRVTLPLAGVRVIVRGANLTRDTLTNQDGAYEFAHLPPGNYRLDTPLLPGLRSQGFFGYHPRRRESPGLIPITATSAYEVNATFIEEMSVSGTVLDAAGRSAEGVYVDVESVAPHPREVLRQARTDPDGRFRVEELSVGQYRITARRPGQPALTKLISIASQQAVTGLILRLP